MTKCGVALVLLVSVVLGTGCAASRVFMLHPPRAELTAPELTVHMGEGTETIHVEAVDLVTRDGLPNRRLSWNDYQTESPDMPVAAVIDRRGPRWCSVLGVLVGGAASYSVAFMLFREREPGRRRECSFFCHAFNGFERAIPISTLTLFGIMTGGAVGTRFCGKTVDVGAVEHRTR